ncbi:MULTISPECIES: hypothetical protein [Mycobacteriaceae]|uniref:Uncharacterized protein n=1 Tax=Mycolicibacterium neoaurum VKM Ac-1815D TaxID=700508 RepID=V5X621_MYCNE|nr:MULTISPECIES: hypothetical protein [Mycobacteriaceae]AHC23462.1 hypothetical protein D174_02125 [Mycolicibacterium neoaurum VKM Ac-1815D]AMO04170.1 hypothetical protein MyAD_02070 [Mycolicibacterium neoaurum]KJQ48617.1 hypothetical protein TS71_19800 [Mycolicibacterium neoaurum]KUM08654.1 hypothetical protein AVZ31_09795 [Mycolicibacterium neoaurum]
MRLTGVVGALLVAAAVVGCGSTEGRPTAASAPESSTSAQPTSTVETMTTRPSPTPEGAPIGTATMQVRGGTAPVTITYQINGEPEQTETNVTLPWEKQYPVYDKVQSSVRADGGDTELICAIIMDGNLVSFVTEPRPTCTFAYY